MLCDCSYEPLGSLVCDLKILFSNLQEEEENVMEVVREEERKRKDSKR